MPITYKNLIILVSSVFLLSCGTKNSDNVDDIEEEEKTTTDVQIGTNEISAQNVFNSLPQRDNVLKIITESKAEYDPTILNNIDNVKGYTTEISEALNLGVYGTDLNVTSVFEQTQESILFLECVQSLSKSLGVNKAFDEKMMGRMDANRDNRDSTLAIISQSFKTTDEYLVSTNRAGASALIVAGVWIEGIYIASKVAKETLSQDGIKTIFEQKKSLSFLIEILQKANVNEKVDYLIADLQAIQVVLNDKSDDVYNLKALRPIELKIGALREKIILPN